eukprot:4325171-Pyramimonas_sp.AAC.1
MLKLAHAQNMLPTSSQSARMFRARRLSQYSQGGEPPGCFHGPVCAHIVQQGKEHTGNINQRPA